MGKSVRRFVGDSSAFVMGAMFLASALNRGIHPPEIFKNGTNTGGKYLCLGQFIISRKIL